jgi:hypothetical protein
LAIDQSAAAIRRNRSKSLHEGPSAGAGRTTTLGAKTYAAPESLDAPKAPTTAAVELTATE